MVEKLLREIQEAFTGVSRSGGVSWKETNVIDGNGCMEARLAAQSKESDGTWQDVARDPPWLTAWGSFCFLDPIGFRYYLAAAMTRTLTHPGEHPPWDLDLEYHLTLPMDQLRDHTLSQWSLLNEGQRRCVAHFLQHMMNLEPCGWEGAFESYWYSFAGP